MPTVARIGPYRLFFYSNEGTEPPHVHVERERFTAKFWIGSVRLAGSTGFGSHELRLLRKLVISREVQVAQAWREHFGA